MSFFIRSNKKSKDLSGTTKKVRLAYKVDLYVLTFEC